MTLPMVAPSVKCRAVQETSGQKVQSAVGQSGLYRQVRQDGGTGLGYRVSRGQDVRSQESFVLLLLLAHKVRESALKSETMRGWYRPFLAGRALRSGAPCSVLRSQHNLYSAAKPTARCLGYSCL